MNRRDVVRTALTHTAPPYVPWSFGFTLEAREKLAAHYGATLDEILADHVRWVGSPDRFEALGRDRVRDRFGVVWDRSCDKDIGIVEGRLLPEPRLADLRLPDPADPTLMAGVDDEIARHPDRFRIYAIGFSLYERAWTLRGMAELLEDFFENPDFLHGLLDAIADWNIAVVRRAIEHNIDAVYFGDDWGTQRGLQMGPKLWRTFVLPRIRRMYDVVHNAGKLVFIHSCGDVSELFGDLVEAGVNCFNPFQPEVMDVAALAATWRGRLAFHGGLSTQRTLPRGTVQDVVRETDRLLEMGRSGGYIFAPAHAVEGDVPVENMVAFIERARAQPGFRA
jgi:uroporphyrinogen decarboxylase